MSSFLALLIAQGELQRDTYGHDFEKMSDEERIEFIKVNVLALTNELHEALGEVGWKPWATSRHVHSDAYLGELVDVFHFLMNLVLVLGYKEEDLAEMFVSRYFQKRAVNAQRQKDGYDGVSGKCPGCGRDIAEANLEERMTQASDGPEQYETLCPCGAVLWVDGVPA